MDKNKRWSPKLKKAVEYLRNCIKDAYASGVDRLPSIFKLAESAGVSVVTMHRAVDMLKEQHILNASPRRGIHIVTMDEASLSDLEKSTTSLADKLKRSIVPKWKEIKDRIVSDIMIGNLSPDSMLPTKKELCNRYGTCTHTLKRAIYELLSEKKLIRYKRGYKVFDIRSGGKRSSSGTIIVITQHDKIYQMASYMPAVRNFFSSLEQQQHTLGFKTKIFSIANFVCSTNDELRSSATIEEVEQKYTTFGYIILTTAIHTSRLEKLLYLFQGVKKPVAVIDDSEFLLTKKTSYSPYLRVFQIGTHNTECGVTVGNFLLSKGHRNISYLTIYNTHWSRNRYEGLVSVIQSSLSKQQTIEHCFQFCNSASVPMLESIREMGQTSEERTDISRVERLYHRKTFAKPWEVFLSQQSIAERLFTEVLQGSNSTAWVCANDTLALMAYFFLQKNRINIPQEIAVMGFDNSFESYAYGISSYNFNYSAAIDAALRFLFSPLVYRAQEKTSIVTISGMLIERESTNICRNV